MYYNGDGTNKNVVVKHERARYALQHYAAIIQDENVNAVSISGVIECNATNVVPLGTFRDLCDSPTYNHTNSLSWIVSSVPDGEMSNWFGSSDGVLVSHTWWDIYENRQHAYDMYLRRSSVVDNGPIAFSTVIRSTDYDINPRFLNWRNEQKHERWLSIYGEID